MAGDLTPGREVIASALTEYRLGQHVMQVAVSVSEAQMEEIRRYVDARVREIAPLVAHRMKELEEALEEVLDSFGRGYRRYSAVRSGWVPEDQVDRWRAVLDRRAR